MFHFIPTLGAPGPDARGRRGNCRSRLHVVLNGRQIYNTWKKQLGRGLCRLQSGEINPRNETGKAEGRNELWAGVQRRECQRGPGSRGAALSNRWPADPACSPPPPASQPPISAQVFMGLVRPALPRPMPAGQKHRWDIEVVMSCPWAHRQGRAGPTWR